MDTTIETFLRRVSRLETPCSNFSPEMFGDSFDYIDRNEIVLAFVGALLGEINHGSSFTGKITNKYFGVVY